MRTTLTRGRGCLSLGWGDGINVLLRKSGSRRISKGNQRKGVKGVSDPSTPCPYTVVIFLRHSQGVTTSACLGLDFSHPPNSYIEILTPFILECDCIWT